MTSVQEVGGKQLQALLERTNAGRITPEELDRFMHNPSGPIIPEAVEKVIQPPKAIVEPKGVCVLPGVGVVCWGYDADGHYRVIDADGKVSMDWKLWKRPEVGVGDKRVFVGLFAGKPLWYRPSEKLDLWELYLGDSLLFERLKLHSAVSWNPKLATPLLTEDGKLYLWVAVSNTPGLFQFQALEVGADGMGERSGPVVFWPVDQLHVDASGNLLATWCQHGARYFGDAFSGKSFPCRMNGGEERFRTFWNVDGGTHAIGTDGRPESEFAMHLSGCDSRKIPVLPPDEIHGHRRIMISVYDDEKNGTGWHHEERGVWKVHHDGKQMYAMGSKLQPARFDVVSELYEREPRKWFYWGLAGKHLCLTRLVLPESKKA